MDNLIPGMILAEPIVNKDQEQILPAGASLTEYTITVLRKWDVQSVIIKDDTESTDSSLREKTHIQAVRRVEMRMRWKPGNPMEEEIYQLAIEHAERLLTKEEE